MNDKRQHHDNDSKTSQSFSNRFQKLPPVMRGALVGVALLAFLYALLPQSLFHSFNCQVQNVPSNSVSSNGYFIDNQVIVVGQRDEIVQVIVTSTPVPTNTPGSPGILETPQAPVPSATASTRETGQVILSPIEDCDLSYLNYRKDKDSGSAVATGKLVMQLYEIPEGSTVESITADITQIAKDKNLSIFADPNYLTRLSDLTDDPCGLPTDPGSGGGRAGGVPGTLSINGQYDASLAEKDFINQWAFDSGGINFPNSSTFTHTYTGNRVQVGVFDTSPYRISFPFAKGITTAFPSPLWFPNWDAGGTTAMSSHGLFVASLIHRIAPSSSIQLVRVLNEDGCGQLWVLNKGLEEYKSVMSRGSRSLDQTVINMSLGIRVPKANSQTATDKELGTLADEDLGTLQQLIDEADQMGAIVVAAAGNDSTVIRDKTTGNIVTTVADMQIPARFTKVIGVVATNPNGQRSCYSNKAFGSDDVAAPGGDNGINPQDPNNLCYPRATSWNIPTTTGTICYDNDIKNCKYGLISLVQTRYGPQYMLWSGTSFAAPLVSGMAALAYQNLDKEQTICVIHGGPISLRTPVPELGAGLINIGNNLSPTVISRCLPSHP